MTFDKLVATDLAALASDSRAHPRPVADSLRELGLAREATAVAPSMLAGLALVPMASVFAGRVARAAAGAMLLAWSIGLWVLLKNPFGDTCEMDLYGGFYGRCNEEGYNGKWLVDAHGHHILAAAAICVLATYGLARWLAERRFESVLQRHRYDPETAARGLLRRIDGWSIALGIAGLTAFVTLVGVVLFVVGALRWDVFWWRHLDPQFANRLRDLAIALPLVTIAAVGVGRRAAGGSRLGLLDHWTIVPAGLILGLATLCVGFELDDGHLSNMPRAWHPSSALRTALTVTGTLAVFVTIAGFALWRRRREHARCGITS
jgi:hypothetical protein